MVNAYWEKYQEKLKNTDRTNQNIFDTVKEMQMDCVLTEQQNKT